ncbi:26S proteasome non-ATPase regulatory subunit 7 [Sparganum proliferum]
MKDESKDETLKIKKAETPKISKVTVHPLVLLGVVDHYNRMGKVSGGQKRVVGVLLGALKGTNLDLNKNLARERIVGWYHSGPKLCANDIKINELFRKYTQNSVLVVVDVRTKESDGLPTEAYIAVEEVHNDGSPTTKTFDHLLSEIGAEEAEEVGVEHLLRDIKDSSLGTLSQRIGSKLSGLDGMMHQLSEIQTYLELVATKRIPVNHAVIYSLQDIFNLLPDLRLHDTVRALNMTSNDQMLVVYVACIMRAILALHDLINNKLANRESERSEDLSSDKSKKAAAPAGDQAAKPVADTSEKPSTDKTAQ